MCYLSYRVCGEEMTGMSHLEPIPPEPSEGVTRMCINNVGMALKFLRNVGYLFPQLHVNFHSSTSIQCAQIECYLSDYCSESLEKLSMCCTRDKAVFDGISRPLIKLKHLKIKIEYRYHPKILRCLNEKTPNLQSLYLRGALGLTYDSRLPFVHFDNVEVFTLDEANIQRALPFSFSNLKHFNIFGNVCIHQGDDCLRIISEAENLKSIHLDCFNYTSSICALFEFQNFLNCVEVVTLKLWSFESPKSIFRFLNRSKYLRMLVFNVYDYFFFKKGYANFIKQLRSLSRYSIAWKMNVGPNTDANECNYKIIFERISN